jgi:hypothetical protein
VGYWEIRIFEDSLRSMTKNEAASAAATQAEMTAGDEEPGDENEDDEVGGRALRSPVWQFFEQVGTREKSGKNKGTGKRMRCTLDGDGECQDALHGGDSSFRFVIFNVRGRERGAEAPQRINRGDQAAVRLQKRCKGTQDWLRDVALSGSRIRQRNKHHQSTSSASILPGLWS